MEIMMTGAFRLVGGEDFKSRKEAEAKAAEEMSISKSSLYALKNSKHGWIFRAAKDKKAIEENIKFILKKAEVMPDADLSVVFITHFMRGRSATNYDADFFARAAKTPEDMLSMCDEDTISNIRKALNG